jgi:microcystin-dependent protein
MSDPYLSEIRMMSFNFAPKGWALCNGQFMPINQNQALFSLLGTTYGGNGQTTFALPDLRGRVPMHFGSAGGVNHTLGEGGGETAHTLNISEMQTHSHSVNAISTTASTNAPKGNLLANSTPNTLYGPVQNLTALNPSTIANVGGSQPHQNMQPYLVINFCIALQGVFPSQT